MNEPNVLSAVPVTSKQSGVFFGKRVLRPGWGLLLFALLFLAITRITAFVLVHAGLQAAVPVGPHAARPMEAIWQAIPLFAAFLAMFLVSTLEHRMLRTYGFRAWAWRKLITLGKLAALAALGGITLLLWATHGIVFDGQPLHGFAIVKYAVVQAIIFFVGALLEEMLFRGYPQYTLTRALLWIYRRIFGIRLPFAAAFWTAALLLSVLFGAIHLANPEENLFGALTAALLALLLCWSLWRTGSLWWAIGFHAAWNWSTAYLLGAPNSGLRIRDHLFASHPQGSMLLSGGGVGPEGSVLVLAGFVVAAALLLAAPRSRVYPDLQT